MERKLRKDAGVMWVLKSLLVSYILTGVLLLLLAVALYKLELNEKAVSAAIVAIYIVDSDRRDHHRQVCTGQALSVGAGAGNRLFCAPVTDHAGSIPYVERRCSEPGDDLRPMCRRRNGRRNAVIMFRPESGHDKS